MKYQYIIRNICSSQQRPTLPQKPPSLKFNSTNQNNLIEFSAISSVVASTQQQQPRFQEQTCLHYLKTNRTCQTIKGNKHQFFRNRINCHITVPPTNFRSETHINTTVYTAPFASFFNDYTVIATTKNQTWQERRWFTNDTNSTIYMQFAANKLHHSERLQWTQHIIKKSIQQPSLIKFIQLINRFALVCVNPSHEHLISSCSQPSLSGQQRNYERQSNNHRGNQSQTHSDRFFEKKKRRKDESFRFLRSGSWPLTSP